MDKWTDCRKLLAKEIEWEAFAISLALAYNSTFWSISYVWDLTGLIFTKLGRIMYLMTFICLIDLDTKFEPHYFRFLEEVKLSYLSHLYQIVRWLMHPMILNISNCIIVYNINKQEITWYNNDSDHNILVYIIDS